MAFTTKRRQIGSNTEETVMNMVAWDLRDPMSRQHQPTLFTHSLKKLTARRK